MSVPKGHLELLKKVSHSCTTLFILDQGLIQAGPGLKAKEKTRIPHDGGASGLSTQAPKRSHTARGSEAEGVVNK